MGDYDILTLEEALAAINSPVSSQNVDKVTGMASGIAAQVRRMCGPVIAEEVTERIAGGRCSLLLGTTPVLEVSGVVETTGTTEATLTEDDYELEASGHFAVIHRRVSGYDSSWAYGTRNVAVTYLAGRFESIDDVDDYWKGGVRTILAMQWAWEAPMWQRNPQGDEFVPEGRFDVLAAVKAQFPFDLLPPGVA